MELHAKKSLGQHFLNSKHVLAEIISAANIQSGETILEIGPGTGILTGELLKSGAKVVAVEKDRRAISILNEKFGAEIGHGQLKVIEGDVLGEIFNSQFSIFNSSFKIVANIPYYITGAILEKFLEHTPRPKRMILLVQKEVAERIVAKNGKESILSISVKAFGEPALVAKVPRGAFTPPPTVDSAILAIENISDRYFKENSIEIPAFFEILKAGFAHKRKFVLNNLISISDTPEYREAVKNAWKKLGLDEKIRAEELGLPDWINIAREII